MQHYCWAHVLEQFICKLHAFSNPMHKIIKDIRLLQVERLYGWLRDGTLVEHLSLSR